MMKRRFKISIAVLIALVVTLLGTFSVDASKKATKAVNWQAPSEKRAYPNLTAHPHAYLAVSLKHQRVDVIDGSKKLYTMVVSSGKDNTTPKGTFAIQGERGANFYNAKLQEGANYWTSFLDHGVYLFHSVPTKADGSYNVAEAKKLGHPASHGCIRMTVADAKWVNENVPTGMKVIIK